MAIKIDRATKPVSGTQLASELATADVRTAFSHNNNTPQRIEYRKRAKNTGKHQLFREQIMKG